MTIEKSKRTVVCASGRGSNFKAVIEAIASGEIRNCNIIGFISDHKNTKAESLAQQHSIPTIAIEFAFFKQRSDFDAEIEKALLSFSPDLILTLGYMRVLAPETVYKFKGRIINTHPSLLPAFPGLHAPMQALQYGVRYTGVTAHFIDEGLDTGPIIGQRVVEILAGDTEKNLTSRILEQEHELIVEVVDLFCADRLQIIGRKVFVTR